MVLGDKIRETLKGVTLDELAKKNKESNNIINTKRTTTKIKN